MKPPFVRNPYNYDVNQASDDSGIECKDPSLAQQQFAEESDINYIANRYGLTGEMPQVLSLPAYSDFEGIFDFQTAQNQVVIAKQQFMQLPAKLRTRFNNDPQQLMAFMDDPNNLEEARFLGLVKPPEPAPQSPKGEAGAKGGGDTLSPDPDAPAKPPKGGKKDT
uniref:Minor capsid protein n=1 Tax=Gokushovirinae environmental samples TaxID=1478972 RepID=A0A2R3UAK5_9VIRU|nr:minor capsid protein [Gokushovirinae environmental samples]